LAHSSLQRLNVERSANLVTLTALDVQLRTIGTILRQTGAGDTLIMKNVYNTEQKICTLLFKGQMSMQAMVESFDGDYHL
jgi:hypothetical protein